MEPEPSISEFINSAKSAVTGSADKTADFVRGSDYESLAGPTAIIWSREVQRDTDLFRSVRFNDASGEVLTEMVLGRYGIERVLDTHGQGVATFARQAPGASGTIWKGTRIGLYGGPRSTVMYYRVAEDCPVSASKIELIVPVEAVELGPDFQVTGVTSGLRLEDPLWDDWTVTELTCGAGTKFEPANDLRARVRRLRKANRVGHEQAFIDTCVRVGASNVAIFRSDFAGDASDVGLNVCYVGDSGFTGSRELVRACTVALRGARVLGDNLQVLPMARVELAVEATITLKDTPAVFDIARLRRVHTEAVRQYLGGSKGRFSYSLIGLFGSIAKQSSAVQDIEFTTPSADAGVIVSGNFPETLNRYVSGPIHFQYVAP